MRGKLRGAATVLTLWVGNCINILGSGPWTLILYFHPVLLIKYRVLSVRSKRGSSGSTLDRVLMRKLTDRLALHPDHKSSSSESMLKLKCRWPVVLR